jgi:hypothetical protein
MIKSSLLFLNLIFLVVFSLESFSQPGGERFLYPTLSGAALNQKEKDMHRDNIKLDPLKIFFNEISLSYEHFRSSSRIEPSASVRNEIDSIIYKKKAERISSMNYILGFYFASDFINAVQYKQDINYAFIERFEDIGLSPFINWGASVKLEYRRYRNAFYYGPRIMEKFVFYNKQYIDDQPGPELEGLIRLQSGHANIIGLGCSVGTQMEKKWFAADFYLAADVRMRIALRKIYQEQNDTGPNIIYPEPKTEHLNRFYPFISLGIRLGYCL